MLFLSKFRNNTTKYALSVAGTLTTSRFGKYINDRFRKFNNKYDSFVRKIDNELFNEEEVRVLSDLERKEKRRLLEQNKEAYIKARKGAISKKRARTVER